jgi:hypothetical protein
LLAKWTFQPGQWLFIGVQNTHVGPTNKCPLFDFKYNLIIDFIEQIFEQNTLGRPFCPFHPFQMTIESSKKMPPEGGISNIGRRPGRSSIKGS